MNQALKDSHVDNNYKDMPKICQIYVKEMLGVIPRQQIQDNYLKQRYAKIWQRQLPKALSHLAVKAVIAVKALQLLNDLYKLSQLRLAVTAIKAVQMLKDLYKLS